MTQISNIYNKRSRSILNQFNQTNNQPTANTNAAAPSHLSPPGPNMNQGRGSVGVSQSAGHGQHTADDSLSKSSPRMGRHRGISPQSREKNFATGASNQASSYSHSAQNNNAQNLSGFNHAAAAGNKPGAHGPGGNVSVQNMSNLSNIISNQNPGGSGMTSTNVQEINNLHVPHSAVPAHAGAADRINHSSPNKIPGSSQIGFAAANISNGGMTMVSS